MSRLTWQTGPHLVDGGRWTEDMRFFESDRMPMDLTEVVIQIRIGPNMADPAFVEATSENGGVVIMDQSSPETKGMARLDIALTLVPPGQHFADVTLLREGVIYAHAIGPIVVRKRLPGVSA